MITFTCTGQGGAGGHAAAVPLAQDVPGSGLRAQGSTWLRCPECGREVRLGYRAMQKLRDSGLPQVDISVLPF